MVLRTLRVPFNMETILMVIFTVIIVDASVREKPIQILRTLATAGLIREYQLEDRQSRMTHNSNVCEDSIPSTCTLPTGYGCEHFVPLCEFKWSQVTNCKSTITLIKDDCRKSCRNCNACTVNVDAGDGSTQGTCGANPAHQKCRADGTCVVIIPDQCKNSAWDLNANFICKNGKTSLCRDRCDGYDNCGDKSDEDPSNCPACDSNPCHNGGTCRCNSCGMYRHWYFGKSHGTAECTCSGPWGGANCRHCSHC